VASCRSHSAGQRTAGVAGPTAVAADVTTRATG